MKIPTWRTMRRFAMGEQNGLRGERLWKAAPMAIRTALNRIAPALQGKEYQSASANSMKRLIAE